MAHDAVPRRAGSVVVLGHSFHWTKVQYWAAPILRTLGRTPMSLLAAALHLRSTDGSDRPSRSQQPDHALTRSENIWMQAFQQAVAMINCSGLFRSKYGLLLVSDHSRGIS